MAFVGNGLLSGIGMSGVKGHKAYIYTLDDPCRRGRPGIPRRQAGTDTPARSPPVGGVHTRTPPGYQDEQRDLHRECGRGGVVAAAGVGVEQGFSHGPQITVLSRVYAHPRGEEASAAGPGEGGLQLFSAASHRLGDTPLRPVLATGLAWVPYVRQGCHELASWKRQFETEHR